METQIETGNPFMLYKDACNMKSNQQNLETYNVVTYVQKLYSTCLVTKLLYAI